MKAAYAAQKSQSSFCQADVLKVVCAFHVAISLNNYLRGLARRTNFEQLLCCCGMELSFGLMPVEMSTAISHSNEKQSPEHSKPAHRGNKPVELQVNTSTFINHAAIAWHENRRKWIGDRSRQTQRTEKDPIISWSTTYEELLSTHEPFPKSIPLPEMVDFLVDIWHDEGLFD